MSGVQVLDVVLLAGDDVDEWLRRWRTEYLPGAVGRGMVEERCWRAWTAPGTVAVRILWSLPDSGAFFAARAAAAADPRVSAFWAYTDEIATGRDRHVLETVTAVRGEKTS
ncbi:hypothetical protein ACFC4G_36415 [Streptomyces sp. NPDC056002]|uniref:hypothetical protein n=1 Tax=Streptomyces sp. NPDC056002 TaxID=3345675 RepID=UPI0035DB8830